MKLSTKSYTKKECYQQKYLLRPIWISMGMNRVRFTENFLSPIFTPYLVSKFWVCYIHGSEEQVQSKECYYMFTDTFFYCCWFSLKNCVFIILISFFGEVSNFCNRILTNQKPGLVIKNWRWKCMDTIQWIQCRNHYFNSICTLTVMIPETMPPAICCKKTHFQ